MLLLLAVSVAVSRAGTVPDSISTNQAASYLGQTKTVCGVVVSSKFAEASNRTPT